MKLSYNLLSYASCDTVSTVVKNSITTLVMYLLEVPPVGEKANHFRMTQSPRVILRLSLLKPLGKLQVPCGNAGDQPEKKAAIAMTVCDF